MNALQNRTSHLIPVLNGYKHDKNKKNCLADDSYTRWRPTRFKRSDPSNRQDSSEPRKRWNYCSKYPIKYRNHNHLKSRQKRGIEYPNTCVAAKISKHQYKT